MASKRDVMVRIRVRAREIAAWRKGARRADETLSEWLRGAAATRLGHGSNDTQAKQDRALTRRRRSARATQ